MNAPEDIDVENLKNEALKLKEENEKLKKKIEELNKEVKKLMTIFFNFKICNYLINYRSKN